MNRIKDLREACGWTQAQLGKRLGVERTAVSNYEREDRQLSPAVIHQLCDLFGCTSDYLLGRSSTPQPVITDADAEILAAYRAAPEHVRTAIDALLAPHKEKDAHRAS